MPWIVPGLVICLRRQDSRFLGTGFCRNVYTSRLCSCDSWCQSPRTCSDPQHYRCHVLPVNVFMKLWNATSQLQHHVQHACSPSGCCNPTGFSCLLAEGVIETNSSLSNSTILVMMETTLVRSTFLPLIGIDV